jgi:repressor LexA
MAHRLRVTVCLTEGDEQRALAYADRVSRRAGLSFRPVTRYTVVLRALRRGLEKMVACPVDDVLDSASSARYTRPMTEAGARSSRSQDLTDRQREVLELIRASINERGYPPTIREIAAKLGLRSTNGVSDHLRALEKKGYVTHDEIKSRGLRLTEKAGGGAEGAASSGELDFVEVRVVGRVTADAPSFALEQLVDVLHVDRGMVGKGEIFGLKILGDAMAQEGILGGDYVFVRRDAVAERGKLVVVLLGEDATVRRYFPEKEFVRFQPANDRIAPILVRATDFRPAMILGVVVAAYRRM